MQHRLNGILIVDKPANMTSAKVVAGVKKLLGVGKAGHAGTLDPFATGVLVCCLNDATKLCRFLLHDKKKYIAVIHLGIETDTQDFTGNIISTSDKTTFTDKKLRLTFKQFEGAVKQLPPVYSALKHKGVPLYKLARRGKPVQKEARSIFISYVKILEISLPLIRFEVSCSAGTYIRTLCADIGEVLGCGGCLKELRRIESSGFTIGQALTLPEMEELHSSHKLSARLISMSDTLQYMPRYIADNLLTDKLKHGSIITRQDIILQQTDIYEDFIKIVDTDDNLIAILNLEKDSDKYHYCCVFPK
ncbi:MAG: tRNA pseudouridine(55) synthase TruB [Desulfobacteraceae bacterium]|nr:tRNA pseudouridine(55) synthase TruB [Pseudomonadota bacterium]MBU4464046.1 tRNA pseudouridine(55) synthase TruB [Pseudomonadota bacterium]MCG2754296.1 tRNA pseudouridine(55) synthase TruB [Desulfobacteraceae bacterium]